MSITEVFDKMEDNLDKMADNLDKTFENLSERIERVFNVPSSKIDIKHRNDIVVETDDEEIVIRIKKKPLTSHRDES